MDTIFENVQFLGEATILNEFSIKELIGKIRNRMHKKPNKRAVEKAVNDTSKDNKPNPEYAHCIKYDNEFAEKIENAALDLINKHTTKLTTLMNNKLKSFNGNKEAFKAEFNMDKNDFVGIDAVWDDDKGYYVNDVIEYIGFSVDMFALDSSVKRWDYENEKVIEAFKFMDMLAADIKKYFSDTLGINIKHFYDGDWDSMSFCIRIPIADIAKLYNIEQ